MYLNIVSIFTGFFVIKQTPTSKDTYHNRAMSVYQQKYDFDDVNKNLNFRK